MGDQDVGVLANELDAELALARLRAAGIHARIELSSPVGLPRSLATPTWAGTEYRIIVRDRDALHARRLLGHPVVPAGAATSRSRWFAIALLLLAGAAPLLLGLLNLLGIH